MKLLPLPEYILRPEAKRLKTKSDDSSRFLVEEYINTQTQHLDVFDTIPFLYIIRNLPAKSVSITVKQGFGFIRSDGRSPIKLLLKQRLYPQHLIRLF